MQIKFDDDYNETTYYFGTLELPDRKDSGSYRFTVEVVYFSNLGNWTVNEIVWEEYEDFPAEKKDKAERRISEMVQEWHGKKCDIDMVISVRDPGDEHQEKLPLIDVEKANEVIKKTPEYKRGKSIISSIGYRGEE
tara:strand:+ start:585 stop:992 length:408 start_codon:yes stop_codon:yes gene_type:complete